MDLDTRGEGGGGAGGGGWAAEVGGRGRRRRGGGVDFLVVTGFVEGGIIGD